MHFSTQHTSEYDIINFYVSVIIICYSVKYEVINFKANFDSHKTNTIHFYNLRLNVELKLHYYYYMLLNYICIHYNSYVLYFYMNCCFVFQIIIIYNQ